jgi:hypothetical protein
MEDLTPAEHEVTLRGERCKVVAEWRMGTRGASGTFGGKVVAVRRGARPRRRSSGGGKAGMHHRGRPASPGPVPVHVTARADDTPPAGPAPGPRAAGRRPGRTAMRRAAPPQISVPWTRSLRP